MIRPPSSSTLSWVPLVRPSASRTALGSVIWPRSATVASMRLSVSVCRDHTYFGMHIQVRMAGTAQPLLRLEFLQVGDQRLHALDRHRVVDRRAHAADRRGGPSGCSRPAASRALRGRRRRAPGRRRWKATFMRERSARATGSLIEAAARRGSRRAASALARLRSAIAARPPCAFSQSKHQAGEVDRVGRRRVDHRVVGRLHACSRRRCGVIGSAPPSRSSRTMTMRQPGRADVLLRAGVDQAVARDVDRPRQDVRRHVGDQRHVAGVGRPVVLDAADRLVRADVDVGGVGVELPLALRRDRREAVRLAARRDVDRAVVLRLGDRVLRPFAGVDVVGARRSRAAGSSARSRSGRSRRPAGTAPCSSSGIASSSRRAASASASIAMNSLPRWLISITDMPLPCQSSISSAAWRSTGSGRAAGPGLKLNGRVMARLSSARGARARAPQARHEIGDADAVTERVVASVASAGCRRHRPRPWRPWPRRSARAASG